MTSDAITPSGPPIESASLNENLEHSNATAVFSSISAMACRQQTLLFAREPLACTMQLWRGP